MVTLKNRCTTTIFTFPHYPTTTTTTIPTTSPILTFENVHKGPIRRPPKFDTFGT